jgi:hypothetical protein
MVLCIYAKKSSIVCSATRVYITSKSNVLHFFDLLESNIAKFAFTPDKILNEDESGFSTVQKRPQKIVAQKGIYQVGVVAGGERGVSTRTEQSTFTMPYYWLFTANPFVLATSPLRLTKDTFFLLST